MLGYAARSRTLAIACRQPQSHSNPWSAPPAAGICGGRMRQRLGVLEHGIEVALIDKLATSLARQVVRKLALYRRNDTRVAVPTAPAGAAEGFAFDQPAGDRK